MMKMQLYGSFFYKRTKRCHEMFVTVITAIKASNNENVTLWVILLGTYKTMSWNFVTVII